VHGQSKNPERIMFNFETKDVKGEFKRMKGLGAKEIAEPYHPDDDQDSWIATLAPGRELFPAHVAHENVDIAIRKANYHGHPSW
jgi:hypothetical protein